MSERLEMLSDKVRNGEPIDFLEAIKVIEYQTQLRKLESKLTFWRRILKFFKYERLILNMRAIRR